MKLKKLVLILVGCFTLVSCATFDPSRHYDGYQSINQLPISNKYSSKFYVLHQPLVQTKILFGTYIRLII